MPTAVTLDRCHCGRPLHPYSLRSEGAGEVIYTQPPILPGETSMVWACDRGEARIAAGLQRGTLVHDVHFESDSGRDRRGACMA